MTTLSDLVNDVLLTMEGYGLDQGRAAFLTGAGITDTDTTLPVSSTENLSEGLAEIGEELIYIQSVDDTASQVTISPDGRGYRGSVATTHPANSRITMNPVLPRGLVKRKVNESIVGLWPTVWGEGTETLTTNGFDIAYELPASVEEVVAVTTEGDPVRRWFLDPSADTTKFASGKAIHIAQGTASTVLVRYRKAPTELANDTDDLSVSGLRNSARAVVTAGAVWRLVSYMDPARLKASTAVIDQLDQTSPIGQATNVAGYLRRVYERELLDEQQRLQVSTPPILHYMA